MQTIQDASASKRTAGHGRGGRRARRGPTARSGPAVPPYITRGIPTFELLGEEGLQVLEDAADTILQEIGIEIGRAHV